MIKKIKIITNKNQKSLYIKRKLVKILLENNFEIVKEEFDLVIAIGGDGTFLSSLKITNFNSDVCYVGINTGTLGFLQEINYKKIDEFVQKLKNNNYSLSSIGIQETKIICLDKVEKFFSLNEIIIREKELNTAFFQININDRLLENFTGDGVLIATSVGSTAYNLSFNGSIVYDNFHTLQITPIAPLNNKSYRNLLNSIIIPEEKHVKIIPKKEKNNLLITIDGENYIYNNVDIIETSIKNKRIKMLRLETFDFTEKINEKFLKD